MEDDLEKLAPILNAFRKLSQDPTTYQESIDKVDARFSQLLSDEVEKHRKVPDGLLAKAHRAGCTALRIIRPARTSEELLKQIQRACGLTDKQVKLLRDIGLVSVTEVGKLTLENSVDILLPHAKASLYLFAIGCLLGMAIMSVALEPAPGLWLVMRGMGLGIGIGSVAGFVLGRSYRAYPVAEKLKTLEPWLNTAQTADIG